MNQPSSSDQGYDPLNNYALPADFRTHGQARESVGASIDALGNSHQRASVYDNGDYHFSYQAPSPSRGIAPLPPFSHICREPAQNDGYPIQYGQQQGPYSLSSVHNTAPPLPYPIPRPSYPQAHAPDQLFQMQEQSRFLRTQHHTAPHSYNRNAESSQLPYISQPSLSEGTRNAGGWTSVPLNHTVNWGQEASHFMPQHSERDNAMPRPSSRFSRMSNKFKKVSYSGGNPMNSSSSVLPESSPAIPGESVLQSAVALAHIHPSVPLETYQRKLNSHVATSMPLERGYSVSNINVCGASNPLPSIKDAETPRETPEASQTGNKSPCTPKQSQEAEHAYMMSPLFPGDPKEIKVSPLPVIAKEEVNDMPLGGVAHTAQKEEEISLRRKSAPLHSGDLLSTIPLKKSKHSKPYADRKREGTVRSWTDKNGENESKRKSQQDPPNRVKLEPTKRASRVAKERRSPGKPSRARRRKAPMSLIQHSGDENSNESSDEEKGRQRSSTQKKRPGARIVCAGNDGKRRKCASNKNEYDSDDVDFETDHKQCLNPDRERSINKGKTKHFREGSRKSPRLSKKMQQVSTKVPPLRFSGRTRETTRNARNARTTKSLDELVDNEDASAIGNETDSSEDFEIIQSDRRKEFDHRRKKWREGQEAKKGTPNSQRKNAKSKDNSRLTKRRRVSDKINSDVESTDSRVDEQTSDSESPNASQRGSQPIEINFTSLSTKRRRRKSDYSDERKRLTQDELSTIRLAFVKHYPPPPSNAQAQGRFEMRYGREMSQAMIQGLWENELKHWSDRWWEFYTRFNTVAREKKLQKPVDKKPTITTKEAEAWAQTFYEDHGDARLPPEARFEQKNTTSEKPDPAESVVGQNNTDTAVSNAEASKDHSIGGAATLEAHGGIQAAAVDTVAQSESIRTRYAANVSVVPAKEVHRCDNPIQSTVGSPAKSNLQAAQQSSSVGPLEQNTIQLTNESIGPQGMS